MKPLLEDVRHQTGGDAPNLIIFSGDLIYGEVNGATVDAQITEARAWLERLHELWGKALGDLPILFVPGNHDVKRSDIEFTQTSWLHSLKSSADLETMIKTGNKTWTRILERQDAWWDFTKSIPKQSWRYDEALRISSGVFERDGIRIGVVGFNTSWSCCEDREKGKLWFTRHQFLTGFDTVQDCDIRIAVLHHPVSWLHESEESWLEGVTNFSKAGLSEKDGESEAVSD